MERAHLSELGSCTNVGCARGKRVLFRCMKRLPFSGVFFGPIQSYEVGLGRAFIRTGTARTRIARNAHRAIIIFANGFTAITFFQISDDELVSKKICTIFLENITLSIFLIYDAIDFCYNL